MWLVLDLLSPISLKSNPCTLIGQKKIKKTQHLCSDWLENIVRDYFNQSEKSATRNDTALFLWNPVSCTCLCPRFSKGLLLDTWRVWLDKKKPNFLGVGKRFTEAKFLVRFGPTRNFRERRSNPDIPIGPWQNRTLPYFFSEVFVGDWGYE